MITDRFPYDKESGSALAHLIKQRRPEWNVNLKQIAFSDFVHMPTDEFPGRSFVDVTLLDKGETHQFYYHRLDIGIALGERVELVVEGEITSRKIVNELNREFEMRFSNTDVFVNDRVLAGVQESVTYRMRARSTSPVWYGETIVEVKSSMSDMPLNVRLLEDGTPRLLEDGSYRLLED